MSKPFLKWAGGKTKLVPFIELNLPSNIRQRLIEPFVGAAAFSLNVEFENYLFNDTNKDLMNLYSLLKTEKKEFIDYCHSFFCTENNKESKYYELRDTFNHSNNIIEKGALFVYLNRHAFNGLCRYNSNGKFNVPFGKYKSPYFPEFEMLSFIEKADRIELMNEDFEQVFLKIEATDLVYCDPPYVPMSNTANFTSYFGNFSQEHQKKLAMLCNLYKKKCNGILISNHDTPFTRELYNDSQIKTINVQRTIAAKGSSRNKVAELLAIFN